MLNAAKHQPRRSDRRAMSIGRASCLAAPWLILRCASNERHWFLPSSGLRPPSPRGRRTYAHVGPLLLGEGGRRPDEGKLAETFIPLLIGAPCRSLAQDVRR